MSTVATLDVRDFETLEPSLDPAVRRLRTDGVLAYPTETVYGLGSLLRPAPIQRLRRAKARDDRPMLVLVRDAGMVADLRWSEEARRLAEIFWPGAVTLVLDDPEARFPAGIRSEGGTVGVRVSPHPVVAALLELLGEPLVSTSANIPGEPPARTGEEAGEVLRALELVAGALLLDAGVLPPSRPSTVLDCSTEPFTVLRAGAVPVERMRCAVPSIREVG